MAAKKPSDTILRRKLSDQVRERLMQLIQDGDLGPGSEMPSERELMSRYGVGRPAIREAMQSLEQMGLIEIHHGERARVLALTPQSMLDQIGMATRHLLAASPETLNDLREARLMFETGMARRAAERARPADLAKLRDLIEEQRDYERDPARYVSADMKFHITLAKISGNPVLTAVSEALLRWLFDFHSELIRLPGNEKVSLAEHQQILERVAKGDAHGAERAMADHLNRVNKLNRKGKLARMRKKEVLNG